MGYTSKMVCLQALVVLCILSSVNGNCATFSFPTIDSSPSYTAAKDKQLHLPFELNTGECGLMTGKYTITISKQDKKKQIFHDICKLMIYQNGTCYQSFTLKCKCEGVKGDYSMNRKMTTSDTTVWRWKLVNSDGVELGIRELEFIVKDLPSTERPPTTFKTSEPTRTTCTGTVATDTTTNTKTDLSTDNEDAASPLVIGIVIAVVVLVVIIAIVATVLAVRRPWRSGLVYQLNE